MFYWVFFAIVLRLYETCTYFPANAQFKCIFDLFRCNLIQKLDKNCGWIWSVAGAPTFEWSVRYAGRYDVFIDINSKLTHPHTHNEKLSPHNFLSTITLEWVQCTAQYLNYIKKNQLVQNFRFRFDEIIEFDNTELKKKNKNYQSNKITHSELDSIHKLSMFFFLQLWACNSGFVQIN